MEYIRCKRKLQIDGFKSVRFIKEIIDPILFYYQN